MQLMDQSFPRLLWASEDKYFSLRILQLSISGATLVAKSSIQVRRVEISGLLVSYLCVK